jgi:hypothetical protein
MPQSTIQANVVHYIMMVSAFFSPIYILLLIVGMAIFFDTFAGRWCARHQAIKEGKDARLEVTSKKTRQGALNKMIIYGLAVITLFLIDGSMVNDAIMLWLKSPVFTFLLTKLTVLFILWIEFDSIDESYYKVKGVRIKDKIKDFFSALKKLIQKLFDFKKQVTKK